MKDYIQKLFAMDNERLQKFLQDEKLNKKKVHSSISVANIGLIEAEIFTAKVLQKKIIRLIVAAEGKP